MPSKYWIKLYHEILDDPKMGTLNDKLYRRTVEMFLIAGDNNKDGELPPIEHMAWRLRLLVEELQADIDELIQVGLITITDDGKLIVTNFAKRQAPVSDAERMDRYRDRKRKVQYGNYEDVTKRNVDTDTDTDKIKASAAPPQTTPKNKKITSDPRSKHPAILALHGITSKYPPKELFDSLIGTLGESPDGKKLVDCRQEWVKRGYNPNAWTWALEWYKDGIPVKFSRNGSSPPTKRPPPEMTPEEIAAELKKGRQK